MSFSDDEQDVPSASPSGGRKPTQLLGNGEKLVRLAAYGNDAAPLEENRQQVMLELTDASSSTGDRAGLDLVAVLDVSGSMEGEKLARMKTAMQFIVNKLGPVDRLSIVSFSDAAKRICPLRFVTEASRDELKRLVDEMKEDCLTNIIDGLQTGRRVLDGRRLGAGRVASIILMSDGLHNTGGDPGAVDVGNLAVYTFGFGDDHDARVLDAIAKNSRGGTFNYVKDGVTLTEPFSQILAGLLSVVVQDLNLTVRQYQGDSKIEKVDPGSYRQTQDAEAGGTVTVSFGDLYSREVRTVIVDLLLPAVEREYVATAIIAQCSYSIQGKLFFSPRPPLRRCIRRIRSANPDAKKPEKVRTELARRNHADMLGKVSEMDVDGARDKLEGAQKALDLEEPNPMIDILKTEVEQLQKLTEPPEIYEKKGRPYARSAKTSHDRQRFAARGDVVRDVRPYATPRMDRYLEQARKFEEDPAVPLPSVNDDVEDEERVRASMEVRLAADQQPWDPPPRTPRTWWGESPPHEHRSSGWAWTMVILCTVLAIAMIVTGAVVFAVFLLYKPKMPYLVVSDARLGLLQYGRQDGTIQYLQASITILAKNSNSKVDASFSGVDLAMRFHGGEVALLRSGPFVVPRESSLSLQYNVVSAGRALDAAGMRSMDESLEAGVVQLDLSGKARTRWKVGIFIKLQFWTRISCRLRFFFPGNGTVMPSDGDRCRSRSP